MGLHRRTSLGLESSPEVEMLEALQRNVFHHKVGSVFPVGVKNPVSFPEGELGGPGAEKFSPTDFIAWKVKGSCSCSHSPFCRDAVPDFPQGSDTRFLIPRAKTALCMNLFEEDLEEGAPTKRAARRDLLGPPGVSSSKTPRRPQGLGALKESSSEEDLREIYSMTRGDPSFP